MHTIKRHIENARWKLGAASKTRAVVLAIMRGDIVLDDVREGVVYVSRDRVGA